MRVSVGLDLVDVREVEASIDTFGARYLNGVFTSHEQESCLGEATVRARGLAARFAAKEAAMKALRPDRDVPRWLDIEVVRSASGACDVQLYNTAADLAQTRGVASLAVSLTHEKDMASAVVVALMEGAAHD